MDKIRALVAICLACFLRQTVTATEADEINNNQVEVIFYNTPLGAWESGNMTAIFRETLAATCTTVCASSQAICGLGGATTFAYAEVVVVSVLQDSDYLAVTYYIKFPAGATLSTPPVTDFLLNKDSAADAVINGRETLYTLLGYEVVEVDNEVFPKKIDWYMNSIMIPITFVMLFVVIATGLGLYYYTYGCKSRYNQIQPTKAVIQNLQHNEQISNNGKA